MPLPATARFTHPKQPESLARLDAAGFGQADKTYNRDPKRDAAVRAKKLEILALLEDCPADPALMPEWVKQCMALGYLGGGRLIRNTRNNLGYIAVRTEILNYDEDTCKRRASSGYTDFFCLRAQYGFTQTLRVPFDGAALSTTCATARSNWHKEDETVKERKLRREAQHLKEEYLQLLEMAKVALAFGQDNKAYTMLSYTFRRMEAWTRAQAQ